MIDSDGYITEPNFENYKKLCMNNLFIKLRVETNKLEEFDYGLIMWLKNELLNSGYTWDEIGSALDYGRK